MEVGGRQNGKSYELLRSPDTFEGVLKFDGATHDKESKMIASHDQSHFFYFVKDCLCNQGAGIKSLPAPEFPPVS